MHNRQELRNMISAKQRTTSGGEDEPPVRLNDHIGELGKTASVLGKQAASNLRKGFAHLTAKAQEMRGSGGSGGGGGGRL